MASRPTLEIGEEDGSEDQVCGGAGGSGSGDARACLVNRFWLMCSLLIELLGQRRGDLTMAVARLVCWKSRYHSFMRHNY